MAAKNDSIQLRSCQRITLGKFLLIMLLQTMKYVVPHQITRGGNVILIAVENEYGSALPVPPVYAENAKIAETMRRGSASFYRGRAYGLT